MRFGRRKVPSALLQGGDYYDGTGMFGTDYEHSQWYCEQQSQTRVEFLRACGLAAGRLIDIGAGYGHFVHQAQIAGWDAEGLEMSAAAIQRASALYGISMIEGELLQFVPHQRYDVATLSQTLEHLPNPVAALDHIRTAILRSRGWLFVDVPNVRSLARLVQRHRWSGWQPGDHVLYFDQRTVCRLLELAGFEVVRVQTTSSMFAGVSPVGIAAAVGLVSDQTTRVGSAQALLIAKASPLRREGGHVLESALLRVVQAVDRVGLGGDLRLMARAKLGGGELRSSRGSPHATARRVHLVARGCR